MTGEISLRGRVMRVGGIKEKVLAAARFGIKHLILPEQNRGGLERSAGRGPAQAASPFHPAHLGTSAAGTAGKMKENSDQIRLLVLSTPQRKAGGQTRRPKPEGRKKAETRNPKPTACSLRRRRNDPRRRGQPTPAGGSGACHLWRFASSDFGIRPSFGLRVSAFGFPALRTRKPGTCRSRVLLPIPPAAPCFFPGWSRPSARTSLGPRRSIRSRPKSRRARWWPICWPKRRSRTPPTPGWVRIRDGEGNERQIPMRFETTSTPTNWVSVYETLSSAGGPGGSEVGRHSLGRAAQSL